MKLQNVHGFKSLDKFVDYEIQKYLIMPKNFESLYEMMFSESDNVMAETSDGYKIKKITYGEFKNRITEITPSLASALYEIAEGEMIGLYMSNSVEWIELFWAILAAGYCPLLMNTRLSDEVLESVIKDYSVKCVISDEKVFSVKTLTYKEATAPTDDKFITRPFGKEVVFMSSGTTNNVKLCAYTGENFFYQVLDSVKIINSCPPIKQHYKGELKQLMLLPLCHVFGFIAVYVWFSFFSRTFVFPRDLSPETIQRTVKKHEVTHIFAVPMVWESVHKAAIRKIKESGAGNYEKFKKAFKLTKSLGNLGIPLAKKLFAEIREGLFGDSICVFITGGSHIKKETLEFFNGIGYNMVNGYGMTEIGITSVERSKMLSIRNSGSLGAPFGYTEYSLDENGVLLVRGRSRASRIMQNGKSTPTNFNEWFRTGDIMKRVGKRYYFSGRKDDLIILEDGENINPIITEAEIQVEGADKVCIFQGSVGITVIASVQGIYADSRLRDIYASLEEKLDAAKIRSSVKKIVFTHESLLRPGDFKLSRKKLAARIESGEISTFDPRNIDEHAVEIANGLEREIRKCFAEALEKDVSEIGIQADFFLDLEGTSLDYFSLLSLIKVRLGVDLVAGEGTKLSTVKDFAEHIKNVSK